MDEIFGNTNFSTGFRKKFLSFFEIFFFSGKKGVLGPLERRLVGLEDRSKRFSDLVKSSSDDFLCPSDDLQSTSDDFFMASDGLQSASDDFLCLSDDFLVPSDHPRCFVSHPRP